MAFSIAIVGRPNVGKSTLFNRLAGRKLALVDDTPGVTRDRREWEINWGDLSFVLIDTAGLEDISDDSLEGRMRAQTDAAVAQADLCVFMVDARAGVTPMDEHFAAILRKSGKSIILLANKCEGTAAQDGVIEAFGLGLGEPIAFSAEHGEGMSDLYQAILPIFEDYIGQELLVHSDRPEDRPLKIAIVGRPNAGKSTLVNRFLDEERLLTGPEAGITRDTISVPFKWRGHDIQLFDTAGMRRKAKVNKKLEKLSVADALRAVKFAEVVVLLIDAARPFDKQDLQIADLIVREGRALVIGINKWDEVKDKQAYRKELDLELERLLPQVRGVPLVTLSALEGKGLDRLLEKVMSVYTLWNIRLSTGRLNRWLEQVLEEHPPPAVKGRRIRLRYITQANARPPTFAVFSQRAADLPASYTRYLINSIRQTFDLPGVPIRLNVRAGKNPYVDK